jgi:hypothetical protein
VTTRILIEEFRLTFHTMEFGFRRVIPPGIEKHGWSDLVRNRDLDGPILSGEKTYEGCSLFDDGIVIRVLRIGSRTIRAI